MKEPLPYIKNRGRKTFLIMKQIESTWIAPGLPAPDDFEDLLDELDEQEDTASKKEAELAVAAGEWDGALSAWHTDSVLALKMGRLAFQDTTKAPAWRSLKANGRSRERIMQEGRDIESAWQASNPAWTPRASLTLTKFQERHTAADAKQAAHTLAEKNADVARASLGVQADAIYDICVKWYEMATANFASGTEEGDLIRTIPTTYNPNQAPGQLRITEHFSSAPNLVKLAWGATRAERYNIYAKAPGAVDFTRILDGVTQTSWLGEGLAAGMWAFKGDAENAEGVGESSDIVIVPVAAAQAA